MLYECRQDSAFSVQLCVLAKMRTLIYTRLTVSFCMVVESAVV